MHLYALIPDREVQGTKVFSEIPGYNDTEQPGEDTRRARE